MAVSVLHKLAATAPVPFFAAVGAGARERVEDLALSPGVERVASPRHASLLLVAGRFRASDQAALQQVHDQLAHPRATLCWDTDAVLDLPDLDNLAADSDPVIAMQTHYRDLWAGTRATETHLLPDEPPVPWRGVGDNGQGGNGMMGGVPYGRPMPMPPQPDLRDGLNLDPYTARFGPFLPLLPPGLVLELTLKGDVVQSAATIEPPFGPSTTQAELFDRARVEAVPIAPLERGRAGHHLRCVAHVLDLLELPARAERCRRMARDVEAGEATDIAGLRRSLQGSGVLRAIPAGLGHMDETETAALGGVVGRAASEAVDARVEQTAYADAGFEPVIQQAGDARARVAQWLAEAEQAEGLARAAGEATLQADALEPPWPEPPAGAGCSADVPDLAQHLPGLEWGEALMLLASFDSATLTRLLPVAQAEDEQAEHGAGHG
ncbi:hypothetical protein [Salinisphaera orenii]|uniref:hypothetical protein n=1 Tax=Salinisphaera orenii TaxID=856731 RepID=UPI000DBE2210